MTSSPTSRTAILGICLIALIWLGLTVMLEIHLGWPQSSIEWAKRAVGWVVEGCLFSSLMRGVRKFHENPSRF